MATAAVSANKAELLAIADSVAREKLDGRKVFSGVLTGIEGNEVLTDVQGLGPTRLPFALIHSAKLVMTDKLIQATAPLSAEGADQIKIIED